MTKSIKRMSILSCGILLAVGMNSCVDNDYDLDDIDLTVQIGGNMISIPGSSTEAITLKDILELDSESSIKEIETAEEAAKYNLAIGDYVLLQSGETKETKYDVPTVAIENLSDNKNSTVLPPFINHQVPGLDRVTVSSPDINNTFEMSQTNIDSQIKSINWADMDVDITLKVGYTTEDDFNGRAVIEKGFKIAFSEALTITVDADSESFLSCEDGHTLVFAEEAYITAAPLNVHIHITHIDFTKLPEGQGLKNGDFNFSSSVVSQGNVSLMISDLSTTGLSLVNLTLNTNLSVNKAEILTVEGVVEPDVTVEDTSFSINDIPDFLTEDNNRLDIYNPRIQLVVNNQSPLKMAISAKLTAMKDNEEIANVNVAYNGNTATDDIILYPNCLNTIVLSRKPVAVSGANVQNVVIEELGQLIQTIPDEIKFHDVYVRSAAGATTFTLGGEMKFKAEYDAIIPLAFGENLNIEYTTDAAEWDLGADNVNFDTAEISLISINTLPLALTPEIQALDKDLNVIDDVLISVEGGIEPGSMTTPSTGKLTITLKSKAENISRLDGVRLTFRVHSSAQTQGVNVNSNMSLKFEDVKVTLRGGVTVDLN